MGLDSNWMIRHSEDSFDDKSVLDTMPEDIAAVAHKNCLPFVENINEYTIAYWRKFNSMHLWVVNNCAEGRDECQPIEVNREQQSELYKVCLEVLLAYKTMPEEEFKKKAAEIFPTCEGCFFGLRDYDEYYIECTKKLAEFLGDVIELLEKPGRKHDKLIYQASW